MKKTITAFAFVLALSAAIYGLISTSPSNAMAKISGEGISSSL